MEPVHILDIIKSRRSVRDFLKRPVEDDQIADILEAGRWAPSGLNNQPWRFVVVTDRELAASLADCTRYDAIIRGAPLLIAVFLDKEMMYDRTKDTLACGAAIQNMLLTAHGMGLGAVWLGEILNKKADVSHILEAPGSMELMAVVAVGYPCTGRARSGVRRDISEIAFAEKFNKSIF
ncbi:MAG: nitroreductase family protein [ANME-2 cluster archaeon]|nr:nitroreductase family protein [ANME-2 cluster archaeon]